MKAWKMNNAIRLCEADFGSGHVSAKKIQFVSVQFWVGVICGSGFGSDYFGFMLFFGR